MGKTEDIVTQDPFFPSYESSAKQAGANFVTVPFEIDKEGTWSFDFALLEELLNEETKMFLLCNP